MLCRYVPNHAPRRTYATKVVALLRHAFGDIEFMIDISWPIDPAMTAYKDKKIVQFEQTKIFEAVGARESVLRLGAHTGTHIDAPAILCVMAQPSIRFH